MQAGIRMDFLLCIFRKFCLQVPTKVSCHAKPDVQQIPTIPTLNKDLLAMADYILTFFLFESQGSSSQSSLVYFFLLSNFCLNFRAMLSLTYLHFLALRLERTYSSELNGHLIPTIPSYILTCSESSDTYKLYLQFKCISISIIWFHPENFLALPVKLFRVWSMCEFGIQWHIYSIFTVEIAVNCPRSSLSCLNAEKKKIQIPQISIFCWVQVDVYDRNRPRKKLKVNKKGKGREWVFKKKERMRNKGYDVPPDTAYTARKRKARF